LCCIAPNPLHSGTYSVPVTYIFIFALISGLKSNIYEERLRELNLQTLSERRHQADMAMVHKILHGIGGLDYTAWFEKAENGPRATRSTADPNNLKVKHGRLDQGRNFFSIRVIEDWNRIPADVKRVDKSETFRAKYRTLRANQMDHAARWEIGRILYWWERDIPERSFPREVLPGPLGTTAQVNK
jgi:hypothetical protein